MYNALPIKYSTTLQFYYGR